MSTASKSRHALHVRTGHPSEASLTHVLGKEDHANYKAVRQRLGAAGLKPEWHWGGQAEGWTLACKDGEATVCSVLLAREPIVGQVALGATQYEALKKGGLLPASIQRSVDGALVTGGRRSVMFKLDSGTGLSQFMALVEARKRL